MSKELDIINKKMDDIIKYASSSIDYINENEKNVVKSIKDNSYTLNAKDIKEIFVFIKETVSKWLANYRITNDIMRISLKEYNRVREKVNELIDNSLLINGLYADGINANLLYIGDELSAAIKTGGNIDNVDIDEVFVLFIDSINGMINDVFYESDKDNITRLKELVLNWQKEYQEYSKLSLISDISINDIYKMVVKICNKYKNNEDIEKNYAENVQYCYSKLVALREKELTKME